MYILTGGRPSARHGINATYITGKALRSPGPSTSSRFPHAHLHTYTCAKDEGRGDTEHSPSPRDRTESASSVGTAAASLRPPRCELSSRTSPGGPHLFFAKFVTLERPAGPGTDARYVHWLPNYHHHLGGSASLPTRDERGIFLDSPVKKRSYTDKQRLSWEITHYRRNCLDTDLDVNTVPLLEHLAHT